MACFDDVAEETDGICIDVVPGKLEPRWLRSASDPAQSDMNGPILRQMQMRKGTNFERSDWADAEIHRDFGTCDVFQPRESETPGRV